jgi:hypothetical protein
MVQVCLTLSERSGSKKTDQTARIRQYDESCICHIEMRLMNLYLSFCHYLTGHPLVMIHVVNIRVIAALELRLDRRWL